MSFIKKIYSKIQALDSDVVVPFSAMKIDGISTDTTRKVLHRLHDNGTITIVKRGYFKKEHVFSELLFVYGSLKKGFDNHDLLGKYAKRVGKARTVKRFAMFEDSFGNYPYLIDAPLFKIKGELYQITRKELMQKIDEFEGVPDLYRREKIEVKSHRGVNRAFVYIQPDAKAPTAQVALEEWTDDSDHKVEKLHDILDAMIKSR